MNSRKCLPAMLWLLLAMSPPAGAVYLNADGLGQALIYPYYTVQSSNGGTFNTLFSVVNHASDAKAIRVRFREALNSRPVAEFNVYLSPNDIWTAGVIPTASGARLITNDKSCTSPQTLATTGVTFSSASYAGSSSDGNGDGLERTREGWFEVIEMATLTGGSATAVTHETGFQGSGLPPDCGAVQGPAGPTLSVGAPTGGLSGTLTLINVAYGMDFSMNAEALAELSRVAFHRVASDPYPDFNAAEIDPLSIVVANGFVYKSLWNRPVDAVSATLMRKSWGGEYVLERATLSTTDFVTTYPTRQFYTEPSAIAPFSAASQRCTPLADTFAGEPMQISRFDREERGGNAGGSSGAPAVPNYRCSSVAVIGLYDSGLATPTGQTTLVLGANSGALPSGLAGSPAQSGWITLRSLSNRSLVSRPESTRTDLASGNIAFGSHAFSGLPVVGFTARTFKNGLLNCGGAVCQGNYGGAFALKYTRSIGG